MMMLFICTTEEDEAQGPRNQPVAVDRGTVRGRRTRTMRSQAEYVRRLQHTAGGGPQNEDDEEEEGLSVKCKWCSLCFAVNDNMFGRIRLFIIQLL